MKRVLIYLAGVTICAWVLSEAQVQDRVALCELFTNTACPSCAPENQAFDLWLKSYTNRNRVAVIKYHVWWPDDADPYYLANISQVQWRCLWYQGFMGYVPRMYIDGSDAGEFHSNWVTSVESRMNVTTPLSLRVAGQLNSGMVRATIQVQATGAIPTGTLVLHTAVTESNLFYTGPNGDPLHEHVMRRMYPDHLGETFVLSASETKSFQRTIQLDSSWTSSNCTLVAFVQVNDTKAIIQAVSQSIGGMPTGVPDEAPVPSAFALCQNFPNPFNPTTTIRYELPKASHVVLKLYNTLGQEVGTLVDGIAEPGYKMVQWDASGMPSGVYFVRLQAGDFVSTKRSLLLK